MDRLKAWMLVMWCAAIAVAQPTSPTSRELLLAEVRQRATEDVKVGRAHASVSDLKALYEAEGERASAPLKTIVSVYDVAFREAEARRPWWQKAAERLTPSGGWILGGISLLALIFHDALKKRIGEALSFLRNVIYVRVAGTKLFRSIALGNYRVAVKKRHAQITLPFRPDRPLKMDEVYVPLKLKGGSELIDPDALFRDRQRLVVTGLPGSGKSMLLRNLAYRYSRADLLKLGTDVVPVLLELSRFNDSDRTIEAMIVDAFDRSDFPRADAFVNAALESGVLMVLFDGLDEVNSAKRQVVVGRITDFLQRFEKCRAVITCRSAVYNNQFAGTVDATVEVAEFSDQQVRTFLTAWSRYLQPPKTVERLMLTLMERPPIMLLARNPLLLTIIAFLYSDTEFELPHSRSQFYAKAVDVLLDQWNVTQNRYSAAQKSMVLRHLALMNQDSPRRDHDRRTMSLTEVLREINSVLPNLNLGAEQAEPILKEIVERSGLLMMIDSGERCQFAHLTLQEFMAATALRDDGEGLIGRFKADPDAWREVVKLWCGLDVNSTSVVQQIEPLEPFTALECLADTVKIDGAMANAMIDRFRQSFGDDSSEDVIRAFAAVASSNRPRGRMLFGALTEIVRNGTPRQRDVAAATLAKTNLPEAADVLAAHPDPTVRLALGRMGDVAIPAIKKAPELDDLARLALLRQIGTPSAVQAMVPFLWDADPEEDVAVTAAAYIASLLSAAGVEAALEKLELTAEQRNAPHAAWVWKPFGEHAASSVAAIANRAGLLIASNAASLPQVELDPRIGAPLLVAKRVEAKLTRSAVLRKVIARRRGIRPEAVDDREIFGTRGDRIDALVELEFDDPQEAHVKRTEFLREIFGAGTPMYCIATHLPADFCGRVVEKLFGNPEAEVDDWKTMLEPVDYSFDEGWHFRGVTALIATVAGLAILELPIGVNWKIVIGVVYLTLVVLAFWPRTDRETVVIFVSVFALLPLGVILGPMGAIVTTRRLGFKKENFVTALVLFLTGLIGLPIWWFILMLAHSHLARFVSSAIAIALLAGAFVAALLLVYRGKRLNRAARNPLRGLLSAEDGTEHRLLGRARYTLWESEHGR